MDKVLPPLPVDMNGEHIHVWLRLTHYDRVDTLDIYGQPLKSDVFYCQFCLAQCAVDRTLAKDDMLNG